MPLYNGYVNLCQNTLQCKSLQENVTIVNVWITVRMCCVALLIRRYLSINPKKKKNVSRLNATSDICVCELIGPMKITKYQNYLFVAGPTSRVYLWTIFFFFFTPFYWVLRTFQKPFIVLFAYAFVCEQNGRGKDELCKRGKTNASWPP